MTSDVERIASIIGNNYSSEPEFDYRNYLPAAEALVENGFGHVPTVLHKAADIWAEGYWQGVDDERTSQEVTGGMTGPNRTNPYRARADRAGGGDE